MATVITTADYIEPPMRRPSLYGEQSEQIHLLAAALARGQQEMRGAVKRHKSHYGPFANLEDCWEAFQSAFPQHGISVVQPTILLASGRRALVTQITHSSGQWIRSVEPLLNDSPDAQKRKSEVTVVRRMALCALLGIADEDDEGAQQRDADVDSATSQRTLGVARLKLRACKSDDERRGVMTRAKELHDAGQLSAADYAAFAAEALAAIGAEAEATVAQPAPAEQPAKRVGRKEAANAQ